MRNEQVTVFGASGKVGSLVVAELLTRGWRVVAFVHAANRLPADPRLKIIQGDIYDPQIVDTAIAGSVAVVSALGSWGTPKKDILTVGMTHIISSMHRHDCGRIVSLTGAEARATSDRLSIIHRFMHLGLSIVARKVLIDGEKHIALLEQSRLDWTVIRSPIMTDSKMSSYRLTQYRPQSWATISRAAVVRAMVDEIDDSYALCHAPFIVNDR